MKRKKYVDKVEKVSCAGFSDPAEIGDTTRRTLAAMQGRGLTLLGDPLL